MIGKAGVCLVLFLVWSPCAFSASGADPNQAQLGAGTQFTFARGQWPLLVPIQFGPRTCDFILDTGSTGTVLDLTFRPQLGEPKGRQRASTPSGKPVVMQVFPAPFARVGAFNLRDCNEVVCADLNKRLAQPLGREVHGILGMSFLRKHVLQIDFDEGRITFLDSGDADRQDWGEEFPLTYRKNGVPQIKLSVGGQPEQEFGIDTGYDASGLMAKDSFRCAVAQGRLKPVNTSTVGLTGVVKSRQIRVGRVTAGPFEYRGLVFTEAQVNLLGLDFLSRHVVTFDFLHDRLYLKKGRSFDKPDEAGMCGVSLERRAGHTVVTGVYKRRPAARAGIKVGDVILRLQGRDANTYPMWEIRDLLRSGHGKGITMVVQRGRNIKEVAVVLEREI
jgi:hypothetical protein